jgi:hypothetical protein
MQYSDAETGLQTRPAVVVDPYVTAEECHVKALDCMIKADMLDDPRQKAAMLQYAEWWRRLAEYRITTAEKTRPRTEASSCFS